MTGGPDGEVDLEIAVPVCRCAAPADLAHRLEESFRRTPGWRVCHEAGPHPRAPIALRVRHVHAIEIKSWATRRQQPRGLATWANAMSLNDLRAGTISRVVVRAVDLGAAEVDDDAALDDSPSRLSEAGIWMPVFDVTKFIRTGVELHVLSESDADRQLDVLAQALNVARQNITIKPPPGWRGYGHPALFPRTPTKS
jgi:hypothetical protein